MTRIVAWIILCVLIVGIFRNRPTMVLVLSLGLCVGVPYGVSRDIFATSVAIHAGTWLILVCCAYQVVQHGGEFARHISHCWRMYCACLTVVIGAVFFTITSSYTLPGGLTQTVDQLVAPFCALLITCWAAETDRLNREQLVRAVLIIAVVECLLALAQKYSASYILYTNYYAMLDHRAYGPLSVASQLRHRYMGTLEHPLTLSLVACASISLLARIRSKLLALVGALVLLAGISASESRVGLVVGTIAALYLLISGDGRVGVKVMSAVGFVSGFVLMSSSELSNGVVSRFSDDLGSSAYRGSSLAYYFSHWTDYLIEGKGVTASYQITIDRGLRASLESGLLMYSVDIGIVLSVVMLGVQLCLLQGAYQSRVAGYAAASAIAIVVPLTYSSIGTQSVASVFAWMILALGASQQNVLSAVTGSLAGASSIGGSAGPR